jgi:hypothetical protein
MAAGSRPSLRESERSCSDSPTVFAVELLHEETRPLTAANPQDQEWYFIAEQASKETDPAKLARLVSQLCDALEKRTRPHLLEAFTDSEEGQYD